MDYDPANDSPVASAWSVERLEPPLALVVTEKLDGCGESFKKPLSPASPSKQPVTKSVYQSLSQALSCSRLSGRAPGVQILASFLQFPVY